MSDNNNICSQCGGVKNSYVEVDYKSGTYITVPNFCTCPLRTEQEQPQRYIMPNLEVMSPTMLARIEENAPLPILYIQPPKHDGKLDENYSVYQAHGSWGVEGVILEYKGTTQAILQPASALSLLAWLKQEETTLQRLVADEDEERNA